VDRIQRARVISQEQQKARLREAEIVSQKNLELLERNKQIV